MADKPPKDLAQQLEKAQGLREGGPITGWIDLFYIHIYIYIFAYLHMYIYIYVRIYIQYIYTVHVGRKDLPKSHKKLEVALESGVKL